MTETGRIPFQVDIAGVIEILGTALYSRPDTALRELIQNAHDAVMRRRHRDLSYTGRIDIVQDAENHTLSVHDDGIGLTLEEAQRYLGTLGIGITGLLKGRGSPPPDAGGDGDGLIGQFGVGLFSSFMLADRIVVESRKIGASHGVRWEAAPNTDILLSTTDRQEPGTSVTLHLKNEYPQYSHNHDVVEHGTKAFADFLPVPIFLNRATTRCNVINVAWFSLAPDQEAVELELEGYFGETPLDAILIRTEKPAAITGALYFTPQRTPGFAGTSTVTVTIRRMVISRRIQGLVPEWASFVRGVLDLGECTPTLSREDLVHDDKFTAVQKAIEQLLYEHLERAAQNDPQRLQALIAWHRYTLAGAALTEPRLRAILRSAYRFPTSQGPLSFREIIDRSLADPLVEMEADRVVWYNTDRRQERWVNTLFTGHSAPCVHSLRSFEDSLLWAFAQDEAERIDLRIASPSAPNFAVTILGIHDMEEAPEAWQEFLACTSAKVMIASFQAEQPCLAFLHEGQDLVETFDDLKKQGNIPAGFERIIATQLEGRQAGRHEILLNRSHRIVSRALTVKTTHPLASVVRLLALAALNAAGATTPREAQQVQMDDLDWIGDALGARKN